MTRRSEKDFRRGLDKILIISEEKNKLNLMESVRSEEHYSLPPGSFSEIVVL